MHVVLIGYRAAGKTTAGRLVAERLGWEYLDVDRGIEAHCGLTIAEIFGRHGEPYYRDVESQVVAEMCAHDDAVVTFGGGTLMRPVNQEHARCDGLVVYLEAEPEELWRRIAADPASAATRPNLAGGGHTWYHVVAAWNPAGGGHDAGAACAGVPRQRRPHPGRHPAAA